MSVKHGRLEYVTSPGSGVNAGYRVDRRSTYNMPLTAVTVNVVNGPSLQHIGSGVRCNNDIFPTPSGA